ncbi:hypothetical protein M9458_019212, partial [Cirrhinus mrigala]
SGKSAPGRGPSSFSSPVLAGLSMALGPDFPPRWLSVGDSRGRHHPPSSPGVVEVMGVAPEGAHLVASGLSTEVVETILQKLYALKWKLFTSWCGHHRQDPINCPVGTVLEFLQDLFSAGLAHSTLEVYVAAISAYHAPLGGIMFPPRSLRGTSPLPFEPIEESSYHYLSAKTALLLALTPSLLPLAWPRLFFTPDRGITTACCTPGL